MSAAHDLASAIVAAGHISRHLAEAQAAQAAGNKASVTFNIEHATHHITELAHNLSELGNDLTRLVPAVGAETGRLVQAATGEDPAPAGRARPGRVTDYDGPGSRRVPEPA